MLVGYPLCSIVTVVCVAVAVRRDFCTLVVGPYLKNSCAAVAVSLSIRLVSSNLLTNSSSVL
jgi:hypothetical protein